MPLYLCRWPDLSFCFVRATDTTDLIIKLDEVSDPSDVRYKPYRGDLFMDFELDIEWEKKKVVTNSKEKPVKYDFEFKRLEHIREWPFFRRGHGSDTHFNMTLNILKFAFRIYTSTMILIRISMRA